MTMAIPRFKLFQPTEMDKALDMLAMYRTSVRVLSGGTDLLPKLRSGELDVLHVVSLNRVRGMRKVNWRDEDGLVIGANARIAEVADQPEVQQYYPALAQACARMATPQIRNQATVVGNLASGDNRSDCYAPLLAYDASLVVVERGSRRQVHLSDVRTESGGFDLEPFELIEAIRVPAPPERTGSVYLRLNPQGENGRTCVGVAAFLTLDLQGRILKSRLALCGAAPIPVRCYEAEAMLDGQKPEPQLLAQAGASCVRAAHPADDAVASAHFRRLGVMVLAKRAVNMCIDQIREMKNA